MKLLYEASNFTIQARWVIPFAILGIIGVLLLLCSRKPFFKLLAAVCLVICAIAALRFCFGYVQVIQAYKQGNYKSVEGYVENFIPASSGGEDQEDMEEESFDIKGFPMVINLLRSLVTTDHRHRVDISRKTVSISRSVIFQRKKDMSSLRFRKENKRIFYNKKYRKLSNDKFPVFCIFRFLYNNKKLILTHKFSTLLSKFCTQTTFFRFRWCNITKILDGCDINTTDNSFDLSLYRNVIEDCLITQ